MRWGMRPSRTGGPPVTNALNTASPHWRSPAEAGEPLPRAIQQFRRVPTGTGSRSTTIGRCVPSRNLDRVQGRRRHEIEASSRPPVYGFLTTAANPVVEPIHSTAMPVIALHQSMPDDALNRDARTRKIVSRLESPRALSWSVQPSTTEMSWLRWHVSLGRRADMTRKSDQVVNDPGRVKTQKFDARRE
jgi:hypothetical protein